MLRTYGAQLECSRSIVAFCSLRFSWPQDKNLRQLQKEMNKIQAAIKIVEGADGLGRSRNPRRAPSPPTNDARPKSLEGRPSGH